ncbi:MAG: hypothetical protein ABIJ86_17070, partial [Spirochaetota bacterium]
MEMNSESLALGLFVGGFRWSGSGAVSDWLAGHEGFHQIDDCQASFGEIRAINYGLRYLAQTAAGQVHWGERLGRWALCPDPHLWDRILGKPLALRRGPLSVLYNLADLAFTSVARFRIIPGLPAYSGLLDTQLGRDFRQDEEYLAVVSQYAAALRQYLDETGPAGSEGPVPWEHKAVRYAASGILELFYHRLSKATSVPIFDNAFSGLNPELFGLLSDGPFRRRVLILVRRDPRDQFVDLVRCSGSTFSWTVSSFIHQYREAQAKTAVFMRNLGVDDSVMVKLIGFEDFVRDTGGART